MKKILLFIFFAGLVHTSFAENIIPPSGKNKEAVNKDMRNCLDKAMRVSSSDRELLKGLDKQLLHGHSTNGYLFEQMLGDPRPIEPRDDGVLTPRESVFNALNSTERSDPYVVCLLLKGYRWESEKETGFEMLQRLAEEGNVRAQAELGKAYYFGLDVTRNNTLAFNMLSAAANANDPDAQFNLAILYSQGDGVLPDDNKSVEWLKKASDAGHQLAQRALPQAEQIAARRKKENDEAAMKLAEVRAGAESGDVTSQLTLANYFIEGIGVRQDANSAIEWYKKAANAGDVVAMRQIGVMYDKGRGVPVDYVEATKWYKAAAEKGDPQAQYNFGVLMYYGVGIEKNETQGKDWIRRAADQNYQMAIRAIQSLK